MTPLTLVRLFTTVYTLVALQVVFLDEAHITYVTLKWLLTCMNEDVSLEVVTAPKGSKAVFASKIFWDLDLKRAILFYNHHLFNSLFGMRGLSQAGIIFAAPGLIAVFAVALTRAPQHFSGTCPFSILRLLAGNLAQHHLLAGCSGNQTHTC